MASNAEKLDLVLQWPSRTPIERLNSMRTVPVYANPKHIDPDGAIVWMVSGGRLVARFRIQSISGMQSVILLSGARAAKGRRLRVEDGSRRILARPKALSDIPVEAGASGNPGHADGFLYLRRRPQAFVRTGPQRQHLSRPIGLENQQVEQWIQENRSQQAFVAERVHHAAEARLVRDYAAWLESRRGRNPLIRHAIVVDGTEILTDAYDQDRHLLLEAKASAERPHVRMAIGQLLDYRRGMAAGVKLAVLVPTRPSDDLLTLVRSLKIHAIWRTDGGAFTDSARGAFT